MLSELFAQKYKKHRYKQMTISNSRKLLLDFVFMRKSSNNSYLGNARVVAYIHTGILFCF